MSRAAIVEVLRSLPIQQVIIVDRYMVCILYITGIVLANKHVVVVDIIRDSKAKATLLSSTGEACTRGRIGVSVHRHRLRHLSWERRPQYVRAKAPVTVIDVALNATKFGVLRAHATLRAAAAVATIKSRLDK